MLSFILTFVKSFLFQLIKRFIFQRILSFILTFIENLIFQLILKSTYQRILSILYINSYWVPYFISYWITYFNTYWVSYFVAEFVNITAATGTRENQLRATIAIYSRFVETNTSNKMPFIATFYCIFIKITIIIIDLFINIG